MSTLENSIMGGIEGASAGGSSGGIWGAIIGGVLGVGTGLLTGEQEEQTAAIQEKQRLARLDYIDDQKGLVAENRSWQIGQNTQRRGMDITQDMYGTLSAFGSNEIAPIEYKPEMIDGAQPISSDASVLNGPGHEQGGVSLGNVSEDPQSEAEGDEVIIKGKYGNPDDSMIFSARLQTPDGSTFAQHAADFSTTKGNNEKRMETTNDRYLVDTLERENEIIDTKLAKLFELQGITKQQQEQEQQQQMQVQQPMQ